MSSIIKTIDVNVPVRTAYNQWTQFEEFPQFMEGVTEIRQLSDSMTHWRTEIGGVKRGVDARLTPRAADGGAPRRRAGGRRADHRAAARRAGGVDVDRGQQAGWCGDVPPP